jgi:hypothetical protein
MSAFVQVPCPLLLVMVHPKASYCTVTYNRTR